MLDGRSSVGNIAVLDIGTFRAYRDKSIEATWRSGDAADCKSAYPGSIPGVASSTYLKNQKLSDVRDAHGALGARERCAGSLLQPEKRTSISAQRRLASGQNPEFTTRYHTFLPADCRVNCLAVAHEIWMRRDALA